MRWMFEHCWMLEGQTYIRELRLSSLPSKRKTVECPHASNMAVLILDLLVLNIAQVNKICNSGAM